jgi:hypothetical protein
MMTTTEAPVRGLLTLTLVPNGSDLCAAVRPSGRDGWPLAVDPPELYWVAFIEAPGQAPWADPANAAPPNQPETSNRRMMIFNSMAIGLRLCQPPIPRRWTASVWSNRIFAASRRSALAEQPVRRAGVRSSQR